MHPAARSLRRHRTPARRALTRIALLVASTTATMVGTGSAQTVPQVSTSGAPLMTALTSLTDSLERAGFAGSVLVANRQHILMFRSMGLADRTTGRAIVAQDRWRWASVSKQVTAALVLREVDAGRIALDEPVATYLPGFSEGERARITVRHLLQHTSGLPNPDAGPRDPDDMPRVYRERGADVGDAAFQRLCDGAPARAPGASFVYTNCDYWVLGALLQARTGHSTVQLLATLLDVAWSPGLAESVVGYLDESTVEPPFELSTYGSAGALTGTLEALLAFDRMLLGPLLSPAAREELWRGNPQFGFAALGAWAFEARLKGCTNPVRIIERRGAIQGIQARNVLLPERGLIVIVFTNRADVDFGEVWQGRGLMFALLSAAAACEEHRP